MNENENLTDNEELETARDPDAAQEPETAPKPDTAEEFDIVTEMFKADSDSEDYFTDEQFAEMDEHETQKVFGGVSAPKRFDAAHAKEAAKDFFGGSWIKLVIFAAIAAAIAAYLIFSPDSIANLYRENFQKNLERLFPAANTVKRPVDYAFEDTSPAADTDDTETTVKTAPLSDSDEETAVASEAEIAVTIPFESASRTKFTEYNSGLLCAASDRIYYIDRKGNTVFDRETPISDPLLDAEGKYALLAQDGSNRLILYENGEQVYDIYTEDDIISCSVSAKGDAVLVTDKPNYHGGICVYNKSGDLVFSWGSGSSDITCAAISSASRRVAAAFVNADGDVYSSIRVFDLADGEYFEALDFADTLLFDISMAGEIVTAFGDNSMITVTATGEVLSDTRFGDGEFSHFACDVKGTKAVMFTASNMPILQTYTARSALRAQLQLSEICDNLDVSGKYLLYSCGRDVYWQKDKSSVAKLYTSKTDILGIELLTSSSFALIHANSVEIVSL